jgi:UDP-3-O-[3-hydroxymyristoyl] glucosamine N-acyltransferase
MPVTAQQILEKWPDTFTLVSGEKSTQADLPSSVENPLANSIVFLNDNKLIQQISSSQVSIAIIAEKNIQKIAVDELNPKIAFISTASPKMAMAFINQIFFAINDNRLQLGDTNIHPTAIIAASAKIGNNCVIGPNVVIYDHVEMGENCFIGAQTVIEAHSQLGDNCHIHAMVFIAHHTEIGHHCEIQPQSAIGTEGYGYATNDQGEHHRIPHYGKVVLEDHVHIGAGVNMDRGTFDNTHIGRHTKIDNHCHLAHNTIIGEQCFITAGFKTAGSTTIGNRCSFGGGSALNGHITICDDVLVGGASTVRNSIKEAGAYMGDPLMPMKEGLRAYASFPHLTELRKTVNKLQKVIDKKAE